VARLDIITLPSHTPHHLQPLDVAIFLDPSNVHSGAYEMHGLCVIEAAQLRRKTFVNGFALLSANP
jgi:hypothetical protein